LLDQSELVNLLLGGGVRRSGLGESSPGLEDRQPGAGGSFECGDGRGRVGGVLLGVATDAGAFRSFCGVEM
jgi:hypothetical protein